MKRITSAIILISLLLLLLYQGSVFHFWLLYVVAIVLALDEYYQLLTAVDFRCFRWSGMVGGLVLSFFFLRRGPESVHIALIAVFAGLFLQALVSSDDFKRSLEGVATTFLGIFYIAYLLGHMVWLRRMESGTDLVIFCLILIWANDTGAYYIGSRYGLTKMAPVLSPGKSWEGFFAGFLMSMVAAWAGASLLPVGGLRAALIMAGIVSCIGPVGDLVESLIKRTSAKKDSGTLIPGHGGLLDRIDSLIFCAPFLFYFYLSLL